MKIGKGAKLGTNVNHARDLRAKMADERRATQVSRSGSSRQAKSGVASRQGQRALEVYMARWRP